MMIICPHSICSGPGLGMASRSRIDHRITCLSSTLSSIEYVYGFVPTGARDLEGAIDNCIHHISFLFGLLGVGQFPPCFSRLSVTALYEPG